MTANITEPFPPTFWPNFAASKTHGYGVLYWVLDRLGVVQGDSQLVDSSLSFAFV